MSDTDYDESDDEPHDQELEDEANCGKFPGSRGCSLAGTEYCDWKCPFSGKRD